MNEQDLERAARDLYDAAEDDFENPPAWDDLPEVQKGFWRELAKGNAGAAIG